MGTVGGSVAGAGCARRRGGRRTHTRRGGRSLGLIHSEMEALSSPGTSPFTVCCSSLFPALSTHGSIHAWGEVSGPRSLYLLTRGQAGSAGELKPFHPPWQQPLMEQRWGRNSRGMFCPVLQVPRVLGPLPIVVIALKAPSLASSPLPFPFPAPHLVFLGFTSPANYLSSQLISRLFL